MDIKKFTKVIMNPVRQRILQYLLLHEIGTANEIQKDLSDVPTASLYRHIKKLDEAGCIKVVEEKKVRGTVEKTYAIVQNPFQREPTKQDIASMIYMGLFSLQSSFLKYFEKPDVDPQKDMLLFQTATLLLSDEEYMEFLQKLGNLYSEVLQNGMKEGRKERRITLVSAPVEEV